MGYKSFSIFRAAVLIGLALPGALTARADFLVIEGSAEVIDTATVEIWGQRIRLSGISVPDARSEDGVKGAQYLRRLLADVKLRCEIWDAPSQIEMLGRCFVASADIVRLLVKMGYARELADEPDGSTSGPGADPRKRLSSPAPARR